MHATDASNGTCLPYVAHHLGDRVLRDGPKLVTSWKGGGHIVRDHTTFCCSMSSYCLARVRLETGLAGRGVIYVIMCMFAGYHPSKYVRFHAYSLEGLKKC